MEQVTVTKCTKLKEWNGKPIYQVELSNGALGESFNQEIPVGTPESQLQITPNPPYADKIKWNKPNAGGNGGGFNRGGGGRAGNESFALAYAKDYAVAVIATGKEFKGEAVIQLAELFYNWMETKKKA